MDATLSLVDHVFKVKKLLRNSAFEFDKTEASTQLSDRVLDHLSRAGRSKKRNYVGENQSVNIQNDVVCDLAFGDIIC